MRVFVGYGYNQRDAWIEQDVFPILQAMSLAIVHGKDMHGEALQDGVKSRIHQADALIGFSTLREGQEQAAFNTHIWVRDEMGHALTLEKPVVEVREQGVRDLPGLLGERQRIDLDLKDRLRCIAELVKVLSHWAMRRLLLCPIDPKHARMIHQAIIREELLVRYRARVNGVDAQAREGRIERVDKGLYLNALGLPNFSLVEIVGTTKNNGVLFNTGWVSADIVRIEF
jgi:hypothetical protein